MELLLSSRMGNAINTMENESKVHVTVLVFSTVKVCGSRGDVVVVEREWRGCVTEEHVTEEAWQRDM